MTPRNVWTQWSLRALGVLLLPVVGVAHGGLLVWVHERTHSAPLLLKLVLLLALLLLAVALLPLGLAALMLWFGDLDDSDDRLSFLIPLALVGLMVGYLATIPGTEPWLLRWRGIETTCTVSHVLDLGGGTPEGSSLVIHYQRLECAAPDAPDEMRTTWGGAEEGENIRVVYDPDGHAGAHPASQVAHAGTYALVTGIGMGSWTLLALARVCLDLPTARRRPPRPTPRDKPTPP